MFDKVSKMQILDAQVKELGLKLSVKAEQLVAGMSRKTCASRMRSLS